MDQVTRKHLDNLRSNDTNARYESFQYIINLTHQPVDWAYEVWNDLLLLLHSKDNHERAIAVQVLSNLAKSDPEKRMLKDLDKIMVVTKDEKFVTARHSLQSLWKIAVVDKSLQQTVTDRLAKRYKDCITEKNCTLIRYDIIEVFRKIYDKVNDEKVKEKALDLVETEEDLKCRKKYSGLWKDVIHADKK